MKKFFVLFAILGMSLSVLAFEYQPKNVDKNPYGKKVEKTAPKESIPSDKREIKNIDEYFRYLPREVQRNWIPYKSTQGYEVTVQFTIFRDGTVKDIHIVNTTLRDANVSVLNAVKAGVPYQPLPQSYEKNSVKAQVFLEYRK